jgi:hypothetical protein
VASRRVSDFVRHHASQLFFFIGGQQQPAVDIHEAAGEGKALIVGSSMTFTVKGIVKSELRAKFWATRLTYSVITRSLMSFAERSISEANCLPVAISLSWETMLRWATLQLPISFTSFLSPAPLADSTTPTNNVAGSKT